MNQDARIRWKTAPWW